MSCVSEMHVQHLLHIQEPSYSLVTVATGFKHILDRKAFSTQQKTVDVFLLHLQLHNINYEHFKQWCPTECVLAF